MSNQLRLTPAQVTAMLLIEGIIAHLEVCANQLAGFLGAKPEGDALIAARDELVKQYAALQQSWKSGIVVVPAGAEKRLVST